MREETVTWKVCGLVGKAQYMMPKCANTDTESSRSQIRWFLGRGHDRRRRGGDHPLHSRAAWLW